MKTEQFGYHLTLDLYGCPLEKLTSFNGCYTLLESLPSKLDMHELMPPYLILAESNEDKGGKDPGGITGYITIAESHISLHTFGKRGFVSLDVYSCKKFSYEDATKYITEYFEPKEVESHTLDRGTKYPSENIYN